MPRKPRNSIKGCFVHNMIQGINREYIFQNNSQKTKYLELIKKYHFRYEVEVISYCIMDNHAHILTYSDDNQSLSLFMKGINTEYALYYNKTKDRVGYVFRDRFNSKPIKDERHLYTCIKYIHMNPVKAKIVNSEEEYKFSSYNDYLNKKNFINSNILNLIFKSEYNYLEKFKSIKYQPMNFEKENVKIEDALNQYITENNFNLSKNSKDIMFIKHFISYLIENEYNFSKAEIAKIFNISRSTLYRKLEKGD